MPTSGQREACKEVHMHVNLIGVTIATGWVRTNQVTAIAKAAFTPENTITILPKVLRSISIGECESASVILYYPNG